jgi:DNA-binding beta-propeller fold protein YncE
MTGRRPAAAAAVLLAAALGLTGCGGAGASRHSATVAARVLPERIIPAARSLLAAAGPQPDGTMWTVAGNPSVGLFEYDTATGRQQASVSVSKAARSVAETPAGVVAVALGTATSGALELLNASDVRARPRTVSLPAPALQVVAASSGPDFYILTAWPSSASITIVSSRTGKIQGSLPAPADAVSLAVDPLQRLVYVLQQDGLVDEIGLRDGRIQSSFEVGKPGESIAVSPDGSQLYVLKGTPAVSNIAVVSAATEGIAKVLPAPSHCVGLLVGANGRELYEVVGSAAYGNIQVFGS